MRFLDRGSRLFLAGFAEERARSYVSCMRIVCPSLPPHFRSIPTGRMLTLRRVIGVLFVMALGMPSSLGGAVDSAGSLGSSSTSEPVAEPSSDSQVSTGAQPRAAKAKKGQKGKRDASKKDGAKSESRKGKVSKNPTAGTASKSGPPRKSPACWPGEAGSDPRLCPPNDPRWGGRWDFMSCIPEEVDQTKMHPRERELGSIGVSLDAAWQHTIGRDDVVIAVLDSGMRWESKDLARKVYLNRGELPLPEGSSVYDRNRDGIFNVDDYAGDTRVKDTNGNGILDGEDLIRAFSDCRDNDENGYPDDIAGYDFFSRSGECGFEGGDNDPRDDTSFGHGTGIATTAAAETNNGIDDAGVCPRCRILPVRVGDSFVVDGNQFARGATFAVRAGATVIASALGSYNNTPAARAAVDLAYENGVPFIGSAADEFSYHHNFPSVYNHALYVNSIRYNHASDYRRATTFWGLNPCTNFGARVWITVPAESCSSGSTARLAGVTGLVESMARETGIQNFHAEELYQILRETADDLDNTNPNWGSLRYPARAGFDQLTGYGRLNALKAVLATKARQLPPMVDLTSPDWFAVVSPERTPMLSVHGSVKIPRAKEAVWRLEYALGVDPREEDYVLVSEGTVEKDKGISNGIMYRTPAARLEPSTAPADGPSGDRPHTAPGDGSQGTRTREASPGAVGLRSVTADSIADAGHDVQAGSLGQPAAAPPGLDAPERAATSSIPPDVPVAKTARSLDSKAPDAASVESEGAVGGQIGQAPIEPERSVPLVDDVLGTLDFRKLPRPSGPAPRDRHERDRYSVTVRLRATDDRGLVSEARRSVFLFDDPAWKKPFPMELGASGEAEPLLVDLNGDGKDEIVLPTADGALNIMTWDAGAVLTRVAPLDPLSAVDPFPGSSSPLSKPGEMRESVLRGAVVGDLYGDGKQEIVVASREGKIYAFDARGLRVPPFPVSVRVDLGSAATPTHPVEVGILSRPVLADLDGKPGLEIIAAGLDGYVYAWRHDGKMLDGFPVRLSRALDERPSPSASPPRHMQERGLDRGQGQGQDESEGAKIISTPAVGDIDGDGTPEIIVGSNEVRDELASAYAIHADGNAHSGGPFLPGWRPFEIAALRPHLLPTIASGVQMDPVLVDADGDGDKEVVLYGVTSDAVLLVDQGPEGRPRVIAKYSMAPGASSGYEGTTFLTGMGSPLVADTDADGEPEIYAPLLPFRMLTLRLKPAVPLEAAVVIGGWPLHGARRTMVGGTKPRVEIPADEETVRPSSSESTRAAAATADSSGKPAPPPASDEIPGARADTSNAKTGMIAMIDNYPRPIEDLMILGKPLAADVDGDGVEEVLAGSGGYLLHAYRKDGGEAAGFPKFTGGWIFSTPAVGDIDGDGRLDLVTVTREGYLFAWGLDASARTRAPVKAPAAAVSGIREGTTFMGEASSSTTR